MTDYARRHPHYDTLSDADKLGRRKTKELLKPYGWKDISTPENTNVYGTDCRFRKLVDVKKQDLFRMIVGGLPVDSELGIEVEVRGLEGKWQYSYSRSYREANPTSNNNKLIKDRLILSPWYFARTLGKKIYYTDDKINPCEYIVSWIRGDLAAIWSMDVIADATLSPIVKKHMPNEDDPEHFVHMNLKYALLIRTNSDGTTTSMVWDGQEGNNLDPDHQARFDAEIADIDEFDAREQQRRKEEKIRNSKVEFEIDKVVAAHG